jgi:hypothetical protein
MTTENATEVSTRIEQDNLSLWKTKPAVFFDAYIAHANDELVCTTLLGTELGRVIERKVYLNKQTRMRSVRVSGNNGALYWGKSCTNNFFLRRVRP